MVRLAPPTAGLAAPHFHFAPRVCRPSTRTYVRLLGPCFKTGRGQAFRQASAFTLALRRGISSAPSSARLGFRRGRTEYKARARAQLRARSHPNPYSLWTFAWPGKLFLTSPASALRCGLPIGASCGVVTIRGGVTLAAAPALARAAAVAASFRGFPNSLSQSGRKVHAPLGI